MTRAQRDQTTGPATTVLAPLSSFIGRGSDVARLGRLLDAHRLVTLSGPGGVGKTRLAAEVARQAEDRFPDGVWLVELGSVADPAQVPTAVMSALDVPQDSGRAPLAVLTEVLAPRRLLLVLDNCEHLRPAVAELCESLLDGTESAAFVLGHRLDRRLKRRKRDDLGDR